MHSLTSLLTILSLTLTLSLTTVLAAPSPPSTPAIVPNSCPICDPSPLKNGCDITTSCTLVGSHTFCACRAGFRADPITDPVDTVNQWRLSTVPYQEGRVFVRPGLKCDTLCRDYEVGREGCRDVPVKDDCA